MNLMVQFIFLSMAPVVLQFREINLQNNRNAFQDFFSVLIKQLALYKHKLSALCDKA